MSLVIQSASEGLLDAAIVSRLIDHVGAIPGSSYGGSGKSSLKRQIRGYANASAFEPWFVLVDLDQEAECAPDLVSGWLDAVPTKLCFRVAVREIESWLFADPATLSDFLGVAPARIPVDPESVPNPKETMVNLARRSRKRSIKEDMVPAPGSGRSVGPAYGVRLIEYATQSWRPEVAGQLSASLKASLRCLERLKSLGNNAL